MNHKNDIGLAAVTAVALMGVLFFFVIMGVFGLRVAIAGLVVFVLSAIAVCRVFPAEDSEL